MPNKTRKKKTTSRKRSPFGAAKMIAPWVGMGLLSLAGLSGASSEPTYQGRSNSRNLTKRNI